MARAMFSRPSAVLFVCLGNICRSPLAEAAFRARAEAAGLVATANFAGTGRWHVGSRPTCAHGRPRSGTGSTSQVIARVRSCRATSRLHPHFRARQVKSHQPAPDRAANRLSAPRPAPRPGEGFGGPGCRRPLLWRVDGFERTWRQVDAAAAALVKQLHGSDRSGRFRARRARDSSPRRFPSSSPVSRRPTASAARTRRRLCLASSRRTRVGRGHGEGVVRVTDLDACHSAAHARVDAHGPSMAPGCEGRIRGRARAAIFDERATSRNPKARIPPRRRLRAARRLSALRRRNQVKASSGDRSSSRPSG